MSVFKLIDHRKNRIVVGTAELTKEEVDTLNKALVQTMFRWWPLEKK